MSEGDELKSQDDIDALLEQAGLAGEGGATAEGGEEGESAPKAGIKNDDIDSLLQSAGVGAGGEGEESFQLESFDDAPLDDDGKLEILMDVNLDVRVVLGRSQMPVEDIIRLKAGSVVELDKLAGDPLDVLVNNRLVARGEVLVLNDNFCVRITEILSSDVQAQR